MSIALKKNNITALIRLVISGIIAHKPLILRIWGLFKSLILSMSNNNSEDFLRKRH